MNPASVLRPSAAATLPTTACAAAMSDQATKISARPVRAPSRSISAPAGTWPSIMPRLKNTAM